MALAAFLSLSAQAQTLPDALTTRTNGHYSKLRWLLSRQQVMTDELSLLAQYSGQRASKNRDSSEKFNLGGVYPINEGGDSKRQLLKLERPWKLPADFTLTGFYDWGQVSINCNPDFVAAADSNNYSLKGHGLALAWATLLKNRFWLTAISPF